MRPMKESVQERRHGGATRKVRATLSPLWSARRRHRLAISAASRRANRGR